MTYKDKLTISEFLVNHENEADHMLDQRLTPLCVRHVGGDIRREIQGEKDLHQYPIKNAEAEANADKDYGRSPMLPSGGYPQAVVQQNMDRHQYHSNGRK